LTLSFTRLSPSPDLAEHVENFWFMRGPDARAMPDGHRILPDGRMEFVFQLGDSFFERAANGRWRMQSPFLLVGQMERRVDVKPSGVIHTVGIHFHPAGVSAFVPGDLRRFRGRIGSLERALKEGLQPFAHTLKQARSDEKRVAHLETFLRGRMTIGDPAIATASRDLCASSGLFHLEALAQGIGLSDRQFRRRFESAVGLPPKRFSRLIRFQRVFEERREDDARAWSQVALECGYYDQAHFNRDFKAFTGVKPTDIVKDADPLTDFFLSVSSKTGRGSRI
jgi:AraC-like DNA-binding protein